VVSRAGLNFIILVCAILNILIAYHIGLFVIPLGLDIVVILEVSIGVLAGIILLGWFGRKRGMDETTTHKLSRINSAIFIGAIAIIVIILLILAGIHPPGMDPEVPFLFVIPPFALLIVLAVSTEELVSWLKLDQSQQDRWQHSAISKA
jgi:hypothetical protein